MFSKNKGIVTVLAATLLILGCGQGMSGKYASSNGIQGITLEFEGGDKVMATVMGNTVEGTYKVEGDKVTVYINGKNMVLTKAADGALTGGPMGMTLTKQ